MCNGNETVNKVKKEHADAELATMVCDTRTPVRRSVVRATVIAAKVTLVVVCAGLVWFFMGWLFLIQLLLVALVAYLAAGRGFKWFYVAFRTLPRDVTALYSYLGLLWQVRSYQRKNLTVAEIFRQNVAKHPNKECFIFEDTEWTFSQVLYFTLGALYHVHHVEEYSNKVANVFRNHGYRKGDVVALMMENRPEFVCLWLGLSKLGVIVPLINYNLRQHPLIHSITVARSQALIFGSELLSDIRDVSGSLHNNLALYCWSPDKINQSTLHEVKNLSELLVDASTTPPVLTDTLGYHDRLMYIYTSGTTGLPKAAVITNSRFVFVSAGIGRVLGFRSSDRVYTPLPLYHTAGGAMAVGQALIAGSCVVIRRRFSASAYFTDVCKYKCTVAQYIGEMCRYILAVPPRPEDTDHKLRLVFGNGLRPQIWSEFTKRFNIPRVGEFYGATEGNANIGECAQYLVEPRRGFLCDAVVRPTPDTSWPPVVFGTEVVWSSFSSEWMLLLVTFMEMICVLMNSCAVNVDNKVGAIGFVSRIIPSVYPISIIRVDPNTGEPIRDSKGLCIVCKPGEPGVFIGKIQPNNPTRAFLGYVDEKESLKKIVHDVFQMGDSAFLRTNIVFVDMCVSIYLNVTGDILESDELGYLYFKDRTGDTFRWKGENVSTSEVEAVISNVANYRDTVVYGVEIQGMEGRAGMAAILDPDESLNLRSLAESIRKCLPSYARPLFVRALQRVDVTGTYKLMKKELQKEGFDPTVIKDRLYFLSPSGTYELLTEDVYNQIFSGKIRL
uniref:Very long-chain fatty acid transport protein n=1 Tax=Timema genevievae TaxID=629358 RepID=A0A7R9K3N2_TIMGE|nr:unnamed protein product [Timema genevievae]